MTKKPSVKDYIPADIYYDLGNAEVFVFGKPKNWKDEFKNHSELISILHERGIRSVYIPDTSTFNGIICEPKDFHKQNKVRGIRVMNGLQTEGLKIPKGSAAIFYSADCPTSVIWYKSFLLAFHAGLGSLLDKQKIITGVPSRNHQSVIDDLKRYIKEPKELNALIVCGIDSKSFKYSVNDSRYKNTNLGIFDYLIKKHGKDAVPFGTQKGNISLFGIIREQLIRAGFDSDKIKNDGVDTYSDIRFHSHYRGKELGEEGLERNVILVINKNKLKSFIFKMFFGVLRWLK